MDSFARPERGNRVVRVARVIRCDEHQLGVLVVEDCFRSGRAEPRAEGTALRRRDFRADVHDALHVERLVPSEMMEQDGADVVARSETRYALARAARSITRRPQPQDPLRPIATRKCSERPLARGACEDTNGFFDRRACKGPREFDVPWVVRIEKVVRRIGQAAAYASRTGCDERTDRAICTQTD